MKLHMTDASGNSCKVRVLASILEVPYEEVHIDLDNREYSKPRFSSSIRGTGIPWRI